jgi:hypothetical protein
MSRRVQLELTLDVEVEAEYDTSGESHEHGP